MAERAVDYFPLVWLGISSIRPTKKFLDGKKKSKKGVDTQSQTAYQEEANLHIARMDTIECTISWQLRGGGWNNLVVSRARVQGRAMARNMYTISM